MATHITSECINCGACVSECPNSAITAGEEIHVIDATHCTECVGFHEAEACQAVCPTTCCLPDPERGETEEVLLARAIALHPENAELKAQATAKTFPSRFRSA